MILLWGLRGDRPLAAVEDVLKRLGCPVFFLSQAEVLDTELELVVGTEIKGLLRHRGRSIELEQIEAVYLRPYDSRRLPVVIRAGEGSSAWEHAINLEDVLTSWVEMTQAFVVNLPSAMASNNSKPYQSALIRTAGFAVPETLITTDADAALEFWRQQGNVVYKSASGVRSIVSRLTSEHLTRLNDVRWCPSQFQQYIAGDDYRVHVVGRDVFACKIVSNADDYRYASQSGDAVHIETCSLPGSVADRCIALTQTLDLNVSGIDLRQTPAGDWYCFEVNPSPGYTYYQDATKQPIAQSVARLLASAGRTNRF